jgi:hypothetical protein
MTGLRLAVVGGAALALGLLLGLWIADRSHTDRPGMRAEDQKPVATSGGMAREAAGATPSPSIPGTVRQSGVPRVPPRLPAPKIEAPSPATPPTGQTPPEWVTEIFHGGGTNRVAPEQIERYLRENRRNAASLLVASRLTGDRSFLREAVKSFPNDPRVLLDWFTFDATTPAERRQALDAFRQAAPDNALGAYLAALDHFENGNVDEGVQAMWQAFQKTEMWDYAFDALQDREEALLAAGYSRAQAAAVALFGTELPQLTHLRTLSRSLLDLNAQYARAGDAESAQVVAEMGIRLGTQMQQQMGHVLIGELVGIAIERGSLERIDPNAILEATGQTVALRLEELEQRKNAIRELAAMDIAGFNETEVVNFIERTKMYGEREALRWLQEKHGGPVSP